MKAYSKEIHDFIKNHVKGRTTKELVKLVNEKFKADFTESKMKAYKSNHHLKSETPCGLPAGRATFLYPTKIKEFIEKNYIGIGPKDMATLLNKTFGTDYTTLQLKSFYGNHKINSGITGYFPKGHMPANKGKKGTYASGCEKSWFKKGHTPKNHKPVGSERIGNRDGYTMIKVAEPNVWKLKHKFVWEQKNGKVPKGYIVTFLDGNRQNFNLNNLALISQAENAIMEKYKLRSKNPEFTKTGILISKVILAGNKKTASERQFQTRQRNNNN